MFGFCAKKKSPLLALPEFKTTDNLFYPLAVPFEQNPNLF
jgi:hypothetical protein